MANKTTLEQIFGAFVAQGTLEEAAEMMADLVDAYPELRAEFTDVLSSGIAVTEKNERSVVDAVNHSGYRALDIDAAIEYCKELLKLFQERVENHI